MTIDTSGFYALQNDITDSTATICINIASSDVIFDGMGYTIDGRDRANSYGIYAYNASTPLTNVTIRNVTVRDWASGIRFNGVQHGRIENSVANSNTGQGIQLLASSDSNTLTENTVSGNAHGINILASSGNRITTTTASGNTYGIYLDSSHGNTVSGSSTLSNTNTGIYLRSSHTNTLTVNTGDMNRYGIYLDSSNGNILSGNTASRNTHTGIALSASSETTVTGTIASSNTNYGILLTASSSNNTLTSNVVSSNAYGLYLTSSAGNTLVSNGASSNANTGIYLTNSHNNALLSNIANSNMNAGIYLTASNSATIASTTAESNTNYGIYLTNSNANTIIDAQVSGNPYGIYLTASSDNRISNSSASSNTYGIYLISSHGNTLSDITATGNMHSGIYIRTSNSSTLSEITTRSNSHSGLYLMTATNSAILDSLASDNTNSGIYLTTSSNFITIHNSSISSNTYGIYLSTSTNNTLSKNRATANTHSAFFLTSSRNNTLMDNSASSNANYGIYLSSSRYNTFANNYFNNTNNAGFGGTIYVNTWNVSKTPGPNIIDGPFLGGNYWAKPDGTGHSQTSSDTDNDGICDSVYTLAAGNIDGLPLHTYIPPPTADFTANITAGMRPLAVAFTDRSTGTGIAAWYWEFGDGNTSTLQNPDHVYGVSGVYDVNFRATTPGGSDWENKTACITVTNATPVAQFMANTTTGKVPLRVRFTDTSTGGVPETWLWEFGDGSTSPEENPIHTYTATGSFTVNLTVANADGSTTRSQTDYISVYPLIPPVANFSANVSQGNLPLAIQFMDTSSGLPVAWYWEFGDGNTSTLQNPIHTFSIPGTYDIHLNVANLDGIDWENKTAFITISDIPPPPATPGRSGGGHGRGIRAISTTTTIPPPTQAVEQETSMPEVTRTIQPSTSSNASSPPVEPPLGEISTVFLPPLDRAALILAGILLLVTASGTAHFLQRWPWWIPVHGITGMMGALLAGCGILYDGVIVAMIRGNSPLVFHAILEVITVMAIVTIPILGLLYMKVLKDNTILSILQPWLRRTGIFSIILLYFLVCGL